MTEEARPHFKLEWALGFILVGFLIAVFLFSVDVIRERVRDVKRRADINAITKALDLYYDRYNQYPASADDWHGWDLSYVRKQGTPSFLKILKDKGDLTEIIFDPVNNSSYHYRYKRFAAGEYGCSRPFYILQVNNFELSSKNIGSGVCGDFDWTKFAPNGYTVQRFE